MQGKAENAFGLFSVYGTVFYKNYSVSIETGAQPKMHTEVAAAFPGLLSTFEQKLDSANCYT